jgi:hypothetical protein
VFDFADARRTHRALLVDVEAKRTTDAEMIGEAVAKAVLGPPKHPPSRR